MSLIDSIPCLLPSPEDSFRLALHANALRTAFALLSPIPLGNTGALITLLSTSSPTPSSIALEKCNFLLVSSVDVGGFIGQLIEK